MEHLKFIVLLDFHWFLKDSFVFTKAWLTSWGTFFANRRHKSGPHVKKNPPPNGSYGHIWDPGGFFGRTKKIVSGFPGPAGRVRPAEVRPEMPRQ